MEQRTHAGPPSTVAYPFRTVLTVLCGLGTLVAPRIGSCEAAAIVKALKPVNPQVVKVVQLISNCPIWGCSPHSSAVAIDEQRQTILAAMKQISTYSTPIIGKAELLLIGRPFDRDTSYKIYMINRYIFNIPSPEKLDISQMHNWRLYYKIMVPREKTAIIDYSWPWAWDKSNHLTLPDTNQFSLIYMGPPIEASEEIEDFNYMRRNYRRRTIF